MAIVLQERDINLDRLTDPRERSRMGNFIPLVDTVFQCQSRLDAGEKPEMRVTNEAGILTGTMPIIQRMIDTWMNITLDLVNDFKANPAMHSMATEYLKAKGEELKKERAERQMRGREVEGKQLEGVGAPATEIEISNLKKLLDAGSDNSI